jgi:hypothetical protein
MAISARRIACYDISLTGGCFAVASIFRDVENLQAELAMERAVVQ